MLLNEIDRLALKSGYRTVVVEAHEKKSLAALLVPPLRQLLFELDRVAGAGDKAKQGLAVLKGFMNGVKILLGDIEVGLDIDPERGAADSGDLDSDLPNLFVAVAEAAEERSIPVALLIDELQYFSEKELSALSEPDANKALRDPTQAVEVDFEPDALKEIFRLTQGYPYFLQEWGYQSWNHAETSPITLLVGAGSHRDREQPRSSAGKTDTKGHDL